MQTELEEIPFNLILDEAPDPARLMREKREAEEAKANRDKTQMQMFD